MTGAQRPFVVVGVSAGIAAYKAVEVCRRLVDAGVHVAPVLTERATHFVGEATFNAVGSEPVQTSLWNEASARAWPCLPDDRLVKKRTGSIGSRVPPADTTTRIP